MKTTGIFSLHLKAVISLFSLAAGLFCLTSCGLDEYYILEPPTVAYNTSYYSTADYTKWFYEFKTNETANSDYYASKKAGFVFLGTEIYYKIYNNYSTLASEKSAISSVNTSSNYSAAATRMIETYTYQTLTTYPSMSWSPFVECAQSNRTVYIRLTQTGTGYEYRAAIALGTTSTVADLSYIGQYNGTTDSFTYNATTDVWTGASSGTVSYSDIDFVVPCRNGTTNSFDFFNNIDDDNEGTLKYGVEPSSGDSDYKYSSTASADNTYYVQLYAVAVGRDSNYTNSYSLVLDLGTVPIEKD
jgi:hypothetical protein